MRSEVIELSIDSGDTLRKIHKKIVDQNDMFSWDDEDYLIYRGYKLKLIFNSGKITFNKFQHCITFNEHYPKTLFPTGKVRIYVNALDSSIDHYLDNSKFGKSEIRATEFKCQMFLPYVHDVIRNCFNEKDDVVVDTTKKHTDRNVKLIYVSVRNVFDIKFVLNTTDRKHFLDAEFDDISISLHMDFMGSPINPISKTVREWKEALPKIFNEFKICVDDVRSKKVLEDSLKRQASLARQRNTDECVLANKKVDAQLARDIQATATSIYTRDYMIKLLNQF